MYNNHVHHTTFAAFYWLETSHSSSKGDDTKLWIPGGKNLD